MDDQDFSRFEDGPWLVGGPERLGAAQAVPTMLGHEEQMLYHWLTAEWAKGRGEIVELGCFVGGSTARLAEGHRKAGLTSKIHAYDRFGVSDSLKESMLYPSGIATFAGHDILPLAQECLSPWAPNIVFHQGEITQMDWNGDAIELLVMDASKSTASMDAMARMFFPFLVEGALLVQPGYLHWRQPWVAVQMHRMRDWFVPVAMAMEGTIVFRVAKPVTEAALRSGATDGLSDKEMILDLTAARDTFLMFGAEAQLNAAKLAVTSSPGVREAWQMEAG